MAQDPSLRKFGVPYNPVVVGNELVFILSTATIPLSPPPPPKGEVNVFYNTINHIDYENPNLCVITFDYSLDYDGIV
jgi:hypothetical protein